MPTDLAQQLLTNPLPNGMLVGPADLQRIQQMIDDTVDNLIAALGGPDFNFTSGSLQVVPGTGMSVVVGGAGQRVIAQGRICDTCPAETFAVAAAGGTARIDLIQIAFNRAAGSTNVERNVRASDAPTGLFPTSVVLVAGSATVDFPSEYAAAPLVFCQPIGSDSTASVNPSAITTTGCTITSSDPTDTRTVQVYAVGIAAAASGVATSIAMENNFAVYQYVEGSSPTEAPSPSEGYEAFATILVPAGATSILAGNITYLFPTLAPPVENFVAQTITALGPISTSGPYNVESGGGVNAQSPGIFGIGTPGKMQIGGKNTAPAYATITTDNETALGIDGPTGGSESVPFNITIGDSTPGTANPDGGLVFGHGGACGNVSVAGYQIGESTYGPTGATVAGEVTAESLDVSGAASLGSAAIAGSATVGANLTVDGTITGNILENCESTDDTVLISAGSGGKTNFKVNPAAYPVGIEIVETINNLAMGADDSHTAANTISFVLPTIAGSSWHLEMHAIMDTDSTGFVVVAGGGAGSTWDAGYTLADTPAQEYVELFGTAGSGATVACTVSPTKAASTQVFSKMLVRAVRVA